MANTTLTFSADLQKLSAAVRVGIATVVKRVALDLHDKIVERTPVDTGRARGSWGLALDAPTEYALPEGDHGGAEGGAQAARAQQGAINGLSEENPFRQVWIFNNLPYIEALEHGHSQQAPNGMVVLSVAEVEAEIDGIMQAAIREQGL